ncbi:5-formyltetrahydrofolate cyclo-ligase [Modestobacter sp. I12A-02628]|uniref:5-formyltetrahydrofolate cyclo-ligase n=1 Tax=Goekera deserti TaxID=2497753 RepID=A0A7K3WGW2_9ACTN|nr:5-formyltetrahydrofolate cyclo-ligase [Goekera deserti]MPQ99395.1 5-formyltetrahydrofolate cyclo-ligase [Goekera deserti]NDI48882.1 5-formyltetrahydrofolate cyclo-ligase [Goekera deserti]NEL55647.1 5-formyltetrahydrofolate cyclo-ligase [Goekera deserti]
MDQGDDSGGKAGLRTRVRERRAQRTPAERAAAAPALAGALLPRLGAARVVAAYVPFPEEPGYGSIPAVFTRLDARVLLPVTPAQGRELAWAVGDGRLAPGRFGVLEPMGPRLPASAVGSADVVVVPALSVALDGTRLGRGGGYYDRALLHARADAVLVALVFDGELVPSLPAEPHDRPVDVVVTPSGGWQDLRG